MAKKKEFAPEPDVVLFMDVSLEPDVSPRWKDVKPRHVLHFVFCGASKDADEWLKNTHNGNNVMAAVVFAKPTKHSVPVIPSKGRVITRNSDAVVVDEEEADLNADTLYLRKMVIEVSYTIRPHS
jgi:hypothetical protein